MSELTLYEDTSLCVVTRISKVTLVMPAWDLSPLLQGFGFQSWFAYTRVLAERLYLTKRVYKVVLQTSIPTQIHQRILYVCSSKG